jgi:hypothetical protein
METFWLIIGGVLAAVIGAWVGYKLQGRGVSDKEIFLNWHNSFFRRAFRGRFNWYTGGTNVESFKDNIQDLMRTLSIGTSKYSNPSNRGGGISQIRSKQYSKTAMAVYDKLELILKIVSDPNNQYKVEKSDEIDEIRDEVISQLNEIWRKLKIDELKLPSKTGEIEL